ncbi:hypothetical protein SRIMM317S_02497 [Streptomyces rimosus subsp. rimosus]
MPAPMHAPSANLGSTPPAHLTPVGFWEYSAGRGLSCFASQ